MRALVTVTGQDRVGIIASVCNLLAERNINILDINQTVMEEFFTMAMLVDTCSCTCSYEELQAAHCTTAASSWACPSAFSGRTSSASMHRI